jgi:RNA polymerase sigma-70 factor (ECF subfamily)
MHSPIGRLIAQPRPMVLLVIEDTVVSPTRVRHDKTDADVVILLQTEKSAQKSDAIGVLYDRYGRLVHSVILHIVHNPSAAEDLVQETFLRIWSRIKLFDSERGDLKCWILTIGRHCAFDYLRSAEGRNDRSSGNGIFEQLAGGLTGGLTRELAAAPESFPFFLSEAPLGKAMARLSGNQRRALELAYFEGMSQTEIAQEVHQPLGTVKTWVRTALQSLRGELCPTSPVPGTLTERRSLDPLNTAARRPSIHLRQS